jgi:hypothetical protein
MEFGSNAAYINRKVIEHLLVNKDELNEKVPEVDLTSDIYEVGSDDLEEDFNSDSDSDIHAHMNYAGAPIEQKFEPVTYLTDFGQEQEINTAIKKNESQTISSKIDENPWF